MKPAISGVESQMPPPKSRNASKVSTVLTFRFQAIELKMDGLHRILCSRRPSKTPDRIEFSRH
ncbi:hypothetical protein IE4872_PD01259 (plasmid) [Rhizobium gallicum]|uniref:Uncharacterized protein n=1 Tax=Rhizobium gallicum TaxID=56730 RepID=A0A1L5NV78_9HYPH|nr:hypothetical protein IE4872_PD01259 [Rhizobium gallicum]